MNFQQLNCEVLAEVRRNKAAQQRFCEWIEKQNEKDTPNREVPLPCMKVSDSVQEKKQQDDTRNDTEDERSRVNANTILKEGNPGSVVEDKGKQKASEEDTPADEEPDGCTMVTIDMK